MSRTRGTWIAVALLLPLLCGGLGALFGLATLTLEGQGASRPAPRPPPAREIQGGGEARPAPIEANPARSEPSAPGEAPSATPDVAPSPAPTAEVEGEPSAWPVTADGIKGAVRESSPRLKRCFEEALSEDPALSGRVLVAFTIAEEESIGRVTDVEVVETELEHGAFEDCLLDAMEELAFDAPDGPVEVNYPFVFESR